MKKSITNTIRAFVEHGLFSTKQDWLESRYWIL